MEILLRPEQWTLDLYPNKEGNEYKLSDYIIQVEQDEKIIFIHTITWAIYEMEKKEFSNILENDLMKLYKVVVPIDLDELEIAHSIYLKRVTPASLPTFKNINHFTVLTTTSCNARCFYCYEEGIEKNLTMDMKTAEDILQFMIKQPTDKNTPIHITWFGGEPLLNKRVIEYITDRLYELNVPFTTSMVSNGFLLNEETAKQFDYWKIRSIQITFDGLHEEYNKIKNFIYTDVDAFLTLVNNIHNLLKYSNTRINIKFNANNDNIFHIYDNILYIKEEFKEYENTGKIQYEASSLFEYVQDPDLAVEGYWEELERIKEIANVRIHNTIDKELAEPTYKRKLINFQCKAYDGQTYIIMPDGKLVRCDLMKPEDIYGDIYNGVTNMDVINAWHNFDSPKLNICKEMKCPLHPLCPKFFRCNSCGICTKQEYIEKRIQEAKNKLIRTYKYVIENK